MTKQYILVGFLVLTLSACSTQKKPMVKHGSDPAAVEIAEIASTLSQSMKQLAANSQQVKQVDLKKDAISPKTYGMGRVASVDWVGPAESLVRRLAALTQYQVKTFGAKPALPVLVSVTKRDAFVGDILQDVSLQSKDQIRMVVFPTNQVIELHYLSNM